MHSKCLLNMLGGCAGTVYFLLKYNVFGFDDPIKQAF